jgi:hypothetical protein
MLAVGRFVMLSISLPKLMRANDIPLTSFAALVVAAKRRNAILHLNVCPSAPFSMICRIQSYEHLLFLSPFHAQPLSVDDTRQLVAIVIGVSADAIPDDLSVSAKYLEPVANCRCLLQRTAAGCPSILRILPAALWPQGPLQSPGRLSWCSRRSCP